MRFLTLLFTIYCLLHINHTRRPTTRGARMHLLLHLLHPLILLMLMLMLLVQRLHPLVLLMLLVQLQPTERQMSYFLSKFFVFTINF